MSPRLVLASGSPRRLSLLRQIGLEPALVVSTDIDERPRAQELPVLHAERLADEKARAAARLPEVGGGGAYVILAADTVVACGRRILPKAQTPAEVETCLRLLSGRRHRVITALAALSGNGTLRKRVVISAVRFKALSDSEIQRYAASREGEGKAGGYAIQGGAAAYIPWLSGSYSNIVGLPLYETAQLLAAFGFSPSHSGQERSESPC